MPLFKSTFLRSLSIWLGFLLLAFINGGLRETIFKATFGVTEPLANQISCLTAVLIWTTFLFYKWSYLNIRTWKQAWAVGIFWFFATLFFETFIIDLNLAWDAIFASYDLLSGNYWALVLIWIGLMPIVFFSILNFRRFINSWGTVDDEQNADVRGVEFLFNPEISSTQALTINSSPENIWPWLVQMGQGRGGFYSYAWLENLLGCRIKNATAILPEFQNLKLGDFITLHMRAPKLKVTVLKKYQTLAFEGWIFNLVPIEKNQTRLSSRVYIETKPGRGRYYNAIMNSFFFDLIHFIMGRKQLMTIKALCEPNHGRRSQA